MKKFLFMLILFSTAFSAVTFAQVTTISQGKSPGAYNSTWTYVEDLTPDSAGLKHETAFIRLDDVLPPGVTFYLSRAYLEIQFNNSTPTIYIENLQEPGQVYTPVSVVYDPAHVVTKLYRYDLSYLDSNNNWETESVDVYIYYPENDHF